LEIRSSATTTSDLRSARELILSRETRKATVSWKADGKVQLQYPEEVAAEESTNKRFELTATRRNRKGYLQSCRLSCMICLHDDDHDSRQSHDILNLADAADVFVASAIPQSRQ